MKPRTFKGFWPVICGIEKYMIRNGFSSKKTDGKAKHFEESFVGEARHNMDREVAHYPFSCIMNTEEVELLYRSLPSRAIFQDRTAYEPLKGRLTDMLNIFSVGTKASLTIIGRCKRCRSFPPHFSGQRDLKIYYMSQQNAPNTKNIWNQIFFGFDKFAGLQGETVIDVVENCSSHNIEYQSFANLNCSFLPTNLTSHLQPVDAALGRSFKCHFHHLLVQHILGQIETQLHRVPLERELFNLRKVSTVYDGVRLMARAWDLVPNSLILNSWLATDILPPLHREAVLKLRQERGDVTRCAARSSSSFLPQYIRNEHKKTAQTAFYRRELYLNAENCPETVVEGDVFNALKYKDTQEDPTPSFSSDIAELNATGVLPQIDSQEMGHMLEVEQSLPVAETISEKTAFMEAIAVGLEDISAFNEVESTVEDQNFDDDEPSVVPAETLRHSKPSVLRYPSALQDEFTELNSAMLPEDFVQSQTPMKLKSIYPEKLDRVRKLQRDNMRQSRLNAFCKE
ncbi:Tigger transposable element-derived protein 4 [Gracilariopsis chorda]|uniref:Tigger transposable element-derived protein 4 n=1 Tax=Gracilariopsis chorda TaxID=448386 RepID=A0A2V3J4Y2_9FLOR|nr:Tigger transposable element-derived protein 4 [Gracilariopsis chorda]|eukprot:PXF49455.1 Tigger transposable element-derived protein 4 [Gracilariopsis chorda]